MSDGFNKKWDQSEVRDSDLRPLLSKSQWQVVVNRRDEYRDRTGAAESEQVVGIARDGDVVQGGGGDGGDWHAGNECWRAHPPAPKFIIELSDGLRLWMCSHDPGHPGPRA